MYVDVRQAAEELGCSETQVRRLIKKNRLKTVNIGLGKKNKRYRIRKKDLVQNGTD